MNHFSDLNRVAQQNLTKLIKKTGSDSFIPYLFIVTVMICIAPVVFNISGFDFSSKVYEFQSVSITEHDVNSNEFKDILYRSISGGLEHGLLEWSAVMAAFLTSIIAFSHFAIRKDITSPIIGIALLCSGLMDAFHTLAALRLVTAAADYSNFIPFTWALSRSFHAVIMFSGVLICMWLQKDKVQSGLRQMLWVGCVFGAISFFLMYFAANSEQLPQSQFPNAWISRPYDVFPLVLFTVSIPLFWSLYRMTPNFLTASLVIALLPEIILEAHMAFGSEALFDNHFNVSHFLKVIAYLVPFSGLIGDYVNSYHMQSQTQVQLEDREKRLQAVMDSSLAGIITINKYGIIKSVNQAFESIFGYERGEITGKNVKILMPESFQNEFDIYMEKYLSTGKSKVFGREVIGKRKNGDEFPVDLSINQFMLGDKHNLCGIVVDITEKKKSENEIIDRMKTAELNSEIGYLVNHENDLNQLLQRCTEAIVKHLDASFARIWFVNEDEKVLHLMASAGLYTHLDGDHSRVPIGKFKIGYIAEQRVPHLTNQVIGDPRVGNQEWAKQEGMVSFAGYPILLGDQLLGVVAMFAKHPLSDITIKALESIAYLLAVGMHRVQSVEEIKQLNSDLMEYAKSLKSSNDDLQSFAYSASHDLQEPLRTVSNYLHLLVRKHKEQLNDDALRYIDNAILASKRMSTLIQDLLELSRISTKGLDIESTSLEQIIRTVTNNLDSLIQESHTEIVYENLPDVYADTSQLAQLIQNLIQNSIKYRSKENPIIKIFAEELDDRVKISLVDNGIGISPEYLDRIFETFKRLHTREEYPGNGVGLALCKKIIERHNGTIWCESEIGKGAAFFLTLPKSPQ